MAKERWWGDLSERELLQLYKRLGPHTSYLHRLCELFERAGFKPTDDFYALARKASESLSELRAKAWYFHCKTATHKEPRYQRRPINPLYRDPVHDIERRMLPHGADPRVGTIKEVPPASDALDGERSA